MTKVIEVSQGRVTIVSDDDYERLNKHKWYVHWDGRNYYVGRNSPTINGKRYTITMHREILGLKKGDGKTADHINRATLDNRRTNLRVVSKAVNCQNHTKHSHNTSGHNGVSWHKRDKKWRAQIKTGGKDIHLGNFDCIDNAIEARKQGETKYWGNNDVKFRNIQEM